MEWVRYLSTSDPIIFTFTDDTQIALNFVDYSKVRVGKEDNYSKLKKHNDVNFDYFYSPAYNSKIVSYRIVKLSEDNSQRYYINVPKRKKEN